jgi:fructose-specific phosphotransferase system IIC component
MALITDARLWWRRWSTWLAVTAGAIAGTITENPSLFIGMIGFFPADWRSFVAGVVAVLVAGVPVLVTHLKQPKLERLRDGEATDPD